MTEEIWVNSRKSNLLFFFFYLGSPGGRTWKSIILNELKLHLGGVLESSLVNLITIKVLLCFVADKG